MTAVEFALLAVPFFGLIAAILQTAMVFLASQILDSAIINASRNIRIGEAQKADSSTFRSHVCKELFGLFGDCAGLHLRINTVTNFQNATATLPADPKCSTSCNWTVLESWSPGTTGDVVLVQAYFRYPLPIPLGPFSIANMADGTRLVGATYVFKNEPF